MNSLSPSAAGSEAEPSAGRAPDSGAAHEHSPVEPPPFQQLLRASAAKQDLCVLAVLTWIAACDGTIDPKERELLRRVAEGSEGSADLPVVLETIQLRRPRDLEAACRFLRNQGSRGDQHLLARLAVSMAVQNGHLSIGENLVLQFLADLLGIRPRAFAKLFEETAGRPFPIPGDPSDPAWWRLRQAGGHTDAGPDAWDRPSQRRREARAWRRWANATGATIGRAGATVGRAGATVGRAAWGVTAGRSFLSGRGFGDPVGAAGPEAIPPLESVAAEAAEDDDGPMTRAEALHLLGLHEGASVAQVHDAYRRLAKARHPDRFSSLGPAAVATATFAFERINKAYAILKHG